MLTICVTKPMGLRSKILRSIVDRFIDRKVTFGLIEVAGKQTKSPDWEVWRKPYDDERLEITGHSAYKRIVSPIPAPADKLGALWIEGNLIWNKEQLDKFLGKKNENRSG